MGAIDSISVIKAKKRESMSKNTFDNTNIPVIFVTLLFFVTLLIIKDIKDAGIAIVDNNNNILKALIGRLNMLASLFINKKFIYIFL